MSDTLRILIDLFIVSVVLIGFGFVDVIDSMSATDMFSAKAIRYVVFTIWLPGLIGLTLPAVSFWWFLKAVQTKGS